MRDRAQLLEKHRWQATSPAGRCGATLARLATIGVLAAALVASPAAAWPPNARILVLSAFPTEGTKLLAAAAPVTDVGVFNGRRFFEGTIAGKKVVMGL